MTSKGPRDVVRIPLNCDGIPPELRVLNQWVAWMFLPPKKPGGKHRKVPIYPKTGGLASTTDAATWGTFDDAVECFRSRGLGGIGFVFAQGGGMSGTDLDECRDIETGAIEPWARQIIEDLNSYTEVSPTGTGVHVFTGGELPPGGHRKGHVEMYDSERFFTVTGVMVEGTPPTVEERTEVLARVHAALIAKRTKAKAPRASAAHADEPTIDRRRAPDDATPACQVFDDDPDDNENPGESPPSSWERVPVGGPLTDSEIQERASQAKNGARFTALWVGDCSAYPSQSEADLALCSILAFWTGPDPTRVDSLFRKSGLMRDKWDERHGEQTIGERTVAFALEGRTEFYKPKGETRPTWRCRLPVESGTIELKCTMLGKGGRFQGVAKLPDGRSMVDKFDLGSRNGRAKFALALKNKNPAVEAENVENLLEDLSGEIAPIIDDIDPDGVDGPDGREREPSDAELLASIVIGAADVELFHTPGRHDAEPFATVTRTEARETFSLRSTAFKWWLVHRFREHTGRAPSSHAITDGVTAISAAALYDGPEFPVALRVASHEGDVWFDLGTDDWSAVKITATDWTVVKSTDVPVRFIRRRGMLPLPVPERGGSIDELRPLVNLPDDTAWMLYVCVIVTYMLPGGPYFVLIANGEQGSAKSTLLRRAREVIDPNKSALRQAPRETRDLMIAATNSHIVAFDNVSNLPASLSDALCTLATGGGFGTRQLFTDDEEKLFESTRPVMLNGIGDVVTAGDLLDRAIVLTLEPIPDDRRQEDALLRQRFDASRGRILGALLDGVSTALARKLTLRFTRMPRMADATAWAVAAAHAYGWTQEQVLSAIEANRSSNVRVVIQSSSVGLALMAFMSGHRTEWEGTAAALLAELPAGAQDPQRDKSWPTSPRALRGALTRLAPSLRRDHIEITFDVRSSDRARTRLIRIEKVGATPSTSSAPSANPTDGSADADPSGRSSDGWGDEVDDRPSADESVEGGPDGAKNAPPASPPDGVDGRPGTLCSAESASVCEPDPAELELIARVEADPELGYRYQNRLGGKRAKGLKETHALRVQVAREVWNEIRGAQ